MAKKILTFTEFEQINEASLTQPSLIQKVLAQAAEVKSASGETQAKAGKKENIGKILIRDLFFATKLGGSLLAAVDSDPDLKAAWTKAKIIPNDSPATIEEIESELSASPEKKKAAEENIKNLNAAGKKTQKPDYKLLPQSSDYEFDDVKDVTWDGLKGILDSEGLSNQINFDQYNLVGIRNRLSTKKKFVNRFTDVVFLMSPQREKKVKYFPATTVPGPFYLINPFRNYYIATGSKDVVNPKGLAIVQPGVYKFKIGKHRGQYEALLQSENIKLQRFQPIDDPAKATFDTYSPGKEENGKYGINIHRGLRSGDTPTIDSYSAGCIVLKNSSDLREILGDMKSKNQQNINFALVQIDDIPARVLSAASNRSGKVQNRKTA